MIEIQISQLMQLGNDDNGLAARKLKSLTAEIRGPIVLHEAQASELYRTYERRLRHVRSNGNTEVLDLEIFVARLAQMTGLIKVFSVLLEDWAFVGFVDPTVPERWKALTAVRRGQGDPIAPL